MTLPAHVEFFRATHTLRRLWDVAEHPLHRRWCGQELTRAQVAVYAGQHELAAAAFARMAERVAATAPIEIRHAFDFYARATDGEVHAWQTMRERLGLCSEIDRDAAVDECMRIWEGAPEDPLERHLAVLHAIESSRARLPEDAFDDASPRLARASATHSLLVVVLRPEAVAAAVDAAGAALQAQWQFLSAIERLCQCGASVGVSSA
jgi:hypothetical protein